LKRLAALPVALAAMNAAADPAADVLAREDARIAAMLAADRATLDDILAEDYTHAHNNGLVETKQEYLTRSIGGPIKYRRFAPADRRVRVYGAAAVITGRAAVEVEMEGQARTLTVRFQAVYVQRQGAWHIVAWQATPLPPS
jgi:hypothetical protein